MSSQWSFVIYVGLFFPTLLSCKKWNTSSMSHMKELSLRGRPSSLWICWSVPSLCPSRGCFMERVEYDCVCKCSECFYGRQNKLVGVVISREGSLMLEAGRGGHIFLTFHPLVPVECSTVYVYSLLNRLFKKQNKTGSNFSPAETHEVKKEETPESVSLWLVLFPPGPLSVCLSRLSGTIPFIRLSLTRYTSRWHHVSKCVLSLGKGLSKWELERRFLTNHVNYSCSWLKHCEILHCS